MSDADQAAVLLAGVKHRHRIPANASIADQEGADVAVSPRALDVQANPTFKDKRDEDD